MILLLAASRLVLLVSRKSDENCNLEAVAPLVARKDATWLITEVMSAMLIDDMVMAAAVVAAEPKFMLPLMLKAPLRLSELMLMEAPWLPLVDIYTDLNGGHSVQHIGH